MKKATTITLLLLTGFAASSQAQYNLRIGSKRLPLSNNNTLNVKDIQPDSVWLEREGVDIGQLIVIVQQENAEAKPFINESNKIEKQVWDKVLVNKIKRVAIVQYQDLKTKKLFPIAINIEIRWQ